METPRYSDAAPMSMTCLISAMLLTFRHTRGSFANQNTRREFTAFVARHPSPVEVGAWVVERSKTTSTQMASGQVNGGDQPCKFLVVLGPDIDSSPVVPNDVPDPIDSPQPEPIDHPCCCHPTSRQVG